MRVGILGGGQLGRMLALSAYPLDMHVRVFDPAPDACAGQVAEHVEAKFTNAEAIVRFAEDLDVVTFEWENVPTVAATYLAGRLPFFPPVQALETSQDRLDEKTLFNSVGIETAPYRPVDTREELHAAVVALGLPAVLKTRRDGYDGKGQFVLREPSDEDAAWEALGPKPGAPALKPGGSLSHRVQVSSSKASCPSPASYRSSACAADAATCASTLWSRTITATASCA